MVQGKKGKITAAMLEHTGGIGTQGTGEVLALTKLMDSVSTVPGEKAEYTGTDAGR